MFGHIKNIKSKAKKWKFELENIIGKYNSEETLIGNIKCDLLF